MPTKLVFVELIIIWAALIIVPTPVYSARFCYDCLNGTPPFHDMTITSDKVYPSCYHHTLINCVEPQSKCLVDVKKTGPKYIVNKGCALDTEENKCSPAKPSSSGQRCVCEKRYCNSDLLVAGGGYIKEIYIVSGGERLSHSYTIAFILAFLIFLSCIKSSEQIACCNGTTELSENDESCWFKGTKCTNVGCEENLACLKMPNMIDCPDVVDCATSKSILNRSLSTSDAQLRSSGGASDPSKVPENPSDPSKVPGNPSDPPKTPTDPAKPTSPNDSSTTSTSQKEPNWVCRILHYVQTTASNETNEITLSTSHYLKQRCFDLNLDTDIKMGCDFAPIVYFRDVHTRITHQKDCYCKSDKCNSNVTNVCLVEDKDVKVFKDTCSSRSVIVSNSKYAILLSIIFLLSLTTILNY